MIKDMGACQGEVSQFTMNAKMTVNKHAFANKITRKVR